MLPSLVAPEDYVVLMFDVDEGIRGPTMEWGFLAALTNQEWNLVDELYTELHFWNPTFTPPWSHDTHSAQEAEDTLHQLRYRCGFAVHAWP